MAAGMIDRDLHETGGGALVAGFVLLFVVLFREPASALAATTASPQSILYFLVLPVLGVLAGVYAYFDGPYSGVALFALATYLGVVGLALILGGVLSPDPIVLLVAVGLVLLVLAVVALVASLQRLAVYLHLDSVSVV